MSKDTVYSLKGLSFVKDGTILGEKKTAVLKEIKYSMFKS